ncbi:retrovirus-related Pol polyprotein from transposon 17.6 [Trichonephila clavipes]|nr:retrovirus-related Pol polyprotein from transposon 17.6 [Trichonephila clavipes]
MRDPLRCYGCGKQGGIKSRCPTYNLNASQKTDVATNHIKAYTAQTRSPRLTLIDITFCGIKGRLCADTGSSHSIAGERMFQIIKDKGLIFQETTLAMSLAQMVNRPQNVSCKEGILRKEVENLLEKDIIEECESPYGATVVLIPKPNNQFRLCIDYRKLNEVTVRDTYPLPRMDDLMQEAKHTTYISTIDLKSGYYQVNLIMLIGTKALLFVHLNLPDQKMPSGLKNAPQPFRD